MDTTARIAKNLRNRAVVIAGAMALALTSASAYAAGAGEVIHLSGTLSVQRPDGTMLVLGVKSEVQTGDVLTTQKDSYAQINFVDGSTVTMRPYTQMKIDAFHYVQDRPQEDNAFFRLLKGGLRTVTGLVGKRGNQDAYRIGTATATIGIRGSIGDTMVCEPNCDGVAIGGDKLPAGTHHQTHNGIYTMEIEGKTATFGGDRVFLAQAGDNSVMTDEPPNGGRLFLAQAARPEGGRVEIGEGQTGFSNGRIITVKVGSIGDGLVKLDISLGGGGLKGAACK